jgi:hypothetical protein
VLSVANAEEKKMSLLSSVILPKLEKELIAMEPEIAQFILIQAKSVGAELLAWIEKKLDAKHANAPQ